MSKRSLLFISIFGVIGAAGCELNPPPECLVGQSMCEEDPEGGGLYKTCGADYKWHMLSCGVSYQNELDGSALSVPVKIGCDKSGKKCAESANLPECQKRDYYCFDGNGKLEHGIYMGCVNQLLVPEMCSSAEKCVDDTSQGIVAVNKKKCSDGSNEDALACNEAVDKPKCENFEYIKDFNGKNPESFFIGVQLKCENDVWTPSYCAGGNLCDTREGQEGQCMTIKSECPTCKDGDILCTRMETSRIESLINQGRLVLRTSNNEEENLSIEAAAKACMDEGGCDIIQIYTDLRWTYSFCPNGCDGNRCRLVVEECTKNGQIIPKCSLDDGVSKYGICIDGIGNENLILQYAPCSRDNDESYVCSEKTTYCAECKPGNTRCAVKDGISYVQSCSDDEYWVSREACSLGCVKNGEEAAECRTTVSCLEGQKKCENDGTTGKRSTCTNGEWSEAVDCNAQASCKSSSECGSCVNSAHVCTPGATEEDKAKVTYCRDGVNVEIDCDTNECSGTDCAEWAEPASICSNNDSNIGYKVTISEGVRTEERCENVSCNASGDNCGECINGTAKCELLESPETDPEDEDGPKFITKVSQCEDGAWNEGTKGKNSCTVDNQIGECVDSPINCENDVITHNGTVSGCVNGKIISKACENVSCSGVECGDCVNDAIVCNNQHMSHAVARQKCVDGKFQVIEFCKSSECDGDKCKAPSETTTPEPEETP